MRLIRGIAAAVLLTGLALGGCSAQPGAAAVVNGERISESELAGAVADFSAVTGQQVDSASMLSTLVVAPILMDVGAEYGAGASEDEAAALLDRQAEAAGLPVPTEPYGPGVIQVAQITLVQQRLGSVPQAAAAGEAISQRIAEADVDVSPRYGEYDPIGQVRPQALPWIAPPTAPVPQPGL